MLLAVIIFITTLAAGDIEMNPGPNCAICGAAFSKGYRLFYPRASSAACLDETVGTHQPFQRLQPTQLYQDLEAVVGRGELAVTSSCVCARCRGDILTAKSRLQMLNTSRNLLVQKLNRTSRDFLQQMVEHPINSHLQTESISSPSHELHDVVVRPSKRWRTSTSSHSGLTPNLKRAMVTTPSKTTHQDPLPIQSTTLDTSLLPMSESPVPHSSSQLSSVVQRPSRIPVRTISSPSVKSTSVTPTHSHVVCSPYHSPRVDTSHSQLPSRIPVPSAQRNQQQHQRQCMMCQHENCYSENSLVDIVFKNDNLCGKIFDRFLWTLHQQCQDLCRKKEFCSILRKTSRANLQSFSFDSVWQEWKEHAPLFAKFLATSANTSLSETTSMTAGICTAGSLLLKARNTHMSALQHMVGLILFHGNASKQV